MSSSCPINSQQVDSYASRISSFIVALLIILYLVSSSKYILYLLCVDFIVKLFTEKKRSLITILALKMRKSFKMQEKLIDAGAIKIANIFALVLVFVLLIGHYLGLNFLTLITAEVFLLCALLNVFFDYCVGCKIYEIIKKFYPSFMS
ncbi:MAG: DUF4395 domain-containing protein [Cohaesibacteraceae bacterium]|nr:DUF4395 domain-containing protein [Cohaesibacteraceae bacterium]PHQ92138.1 MAG: hypothetical protein COB42_02265 [Sulfurimonas sp.]